MWTHLSDKVYKAQKEYRCFLCGERINVGEKYCRRVGVDSGDLFEAKMHLECKEVSKGFTMDDWDSGHPHEMLERPKDLKTHIQGLLTVK